MWDWDIRLALIPPVLLLSVSAFMAVMAYLHEHRHRKDHH